MLSCLCLVLLSLLLAVVAPVSAAIDCDGLDDSALSTGILADYKAAGAGTWMAWFTPAGANPVTPLSCDDNTVQKIMGSASGSFVQRIVIGRKETSLCVSHYDGGLDTLTAAYGGPGTTVHVAAVHSAGTLTMYLNGVVATSAASVDTSFNASPIFACNNASANHYWYEGRVHQITISNVAYSAGEIAALALSRRPRLRKSVATGDWLFNNCADGASGHNVAFRDHSGNGRTMTGNHAANTSGMMCRGSRIFSYGGAIQ